jgi:hypothetical protein
MKRLVVAVGVAFALLIVGLAVGTSSASASASGCTWAPGGLGSYQCMEINGSSTHINWVQESYGYGAGYSNVCRYQAQWEGDAQGWGWYYYWSNYTAGCGLNGAFSGHYTVGAGYAGGNFVNQTPFYGWWKSDTTGNSWTSPVKEMIYR